MKATILQLTESLVIVARATASSHGDPLQRRPMTSIRAARQSAPTDRNRLPALCVHSSAHQLCNINPVPLAKQDRRIAQRVSLFLVPAPPRVSFVLYAVRPPFFRSFTTNIRAVLVNLSTVHSFFNYYLNPQLQHVQDTGFDSGFYRSRLCCK